jgi:hypothetical protein
LNCVCVHFESASCVRVVVNKHWASRSLFVNSKFVGLAFVVDDDGADDFNSVHGVLYESNFDQIGNV